MVGTQKIFALVLGMIILLVGIIGFFNNSLVGNSGYFSTNTFQDILHLIAGISGIYAGTKGIGQGYNFTIGWIGIALGILGFIPGIDTLFANLLRTGASITVLHLVIGIVALIVYYSAKKK